METPPNPITDTHAVAAGIPLLFVRGDRVVRILYLAPRTAAHGMINAVVIDDDASNRDYLRTLLKSTAPDVCIVGEASNIHDGMAAVAASAPGLVFLDVEMPGGSGFDMLQKLGSWPFEVIFTTGFQRYAIQAIRFSALDYLLKPVQPDELTEALDRFRERHMDVDRRTVQQQFLSNIGERDEQAMKLTLTTGDRTYFVPPAELSHCTADDNYTELHTLDGRRFVSARTLKDYEDMLLPLGFLRVHRSTLVNKAQITHLDDGHVVLKNQARLEVSRRKREEVLKALAG